MTNPIFPQTDPTKPGADARELTQKPQSTFDPEIPSFFDAPGVQAPPAPPTPVNPDPEVPLWSDVPTPEQVHQAQMAQAAARAAEENKPFIYKAPAALLTSLPRAVGSLIEGSGVTFDVTGKIMAPDAVQNPFTDLTSDMSLLDMARVVSGGALQEAGLIFKKLGSRIVEDSPAASEENMQLQEAFAKNEWSRIGTLIGSNPEVVFEMVGETIPHLMAMMYGGAWATGKLPAGTAMLDRTVVSGLGMAAANAVASFGRNLEESQGVQYEDSPYSAIDRAIYKTLGETGSIIATLGLANQPLTRKWLGGTFRDLIFKSLGGASIEVGANAGIRSVIGEELSLGQYAQQFSMEAIMGMPADIIVANNIRKQAGPSFVAAMWGGDAPRRAGFVDQTYTDQVQMPLMDMYLRAKGRETRARKAILEQAGVEKPSEINIEDALALEGELIGRNLIETSLQTHAPKGLFRNHLGEWEPKTDTILPLAPDGEGQVTLLTAIDTKPLEILEARHNRLLAAEEEATTPNAARQIRLEESAEKLARERDKIEKQKLFWEEIAKEAQAIMKEYRLEEPLYLGDLNASNHPDNKPDTRGLAAMTMPGDPKVVFIDPGLLMGIEKGKEKNYLKADRNELRQTLTHEIGHSIFTGRLYKALQYRPESAPFISEYKSHLDAVKAGKITVEESLQIFAAPARIAQATKALEPILDQPASVMFEQQPRLSEYIYSLNEYTAEQLVKHLRYGENATSPAVKKLFRQMQKDKWETKTHLAGKLKGKNVFGPEPGFAKFIEWHSATGNLRGARRSIPIADILMPRSENKIWEKMEWKEFTAGPQNPVTKSVPIEKLARLVEDKSVPLVERRAWLRVLQTAAGATVNNKIVPSEWAGAFEAEVRFQKAQDAYDKANRPILRWLKNVKADPKWSKEIVRFNWAMGKMLNILQLQELNPTFAPLNNYVGHIRSAANYRSEHLWAGKVGVDALHALNKGQRDAVGRWLLADDLDGSHSSRERARDSFGVTDRGWKAGLLAKEHFEFVREEYRQVELAFLERNNATEDQIREVNEKYDALKGVPYFPHTRFGDRYVVATAARDGKYNGIDRQKGDTVEFIMASSERELARNRKELEKRYEEGAVNFRERLVDEKLRQLEGTPVALLARVKEPLAKELGLDDAQKVLLEEFIRDMAPETKAIKNVDTRKKVEGQSIDSLRVFSDYVTRHASTLMRLKHKDLINNTLGEFDAFIKSQGKEGSESRRESREVKKFQMLRRHLHDHQDYFFNPTNEWSKMRALGFLWYIGGNISSAVVNLSQIPTVVFPYLGMRYGRQLATKELTKATRDIGSLFAKKDSTTRLTDMEKDLILQAKADNVLQQSLAQSIATVNNAGVLERFTGSSKTERFVTSFNHMSTYLFQAAETANRHLTFLAAIRLAEKEGIQNPDAIYRAGVEAVEQTNYNYERWNRPEFMRGIGAPVFLFQNYVQNTLFRLFRGGQAARDMLLVFAAFSGVMGMPGAEDASELVEGLAGFAGKKNVNVELWAKRMLESLNLPSETILHGFGRTGIGLAELGQSMGLPMATPDLSGRLSLGSIDPLGITAALKTMGQTMPGAGKPMTQVAGEMVEATPLGATLMGVVGTIGALSGDPGVAGPNTIKQLEKAAPLFIRNAMTAGRWGMSEEETDAAGNRTIEFNPDNPATWAEIGMKAIGFNPKRVAEERQKDFFIREKHYYWENQRRWIMRQYREALLSGDNNSLAQIGQELAKFNGDAPSAFLINKDSIKRSLKSASKRRTLVEQGVATGDKRTIQIAQEIEALYDVDSGHRKDGQPGSVEVEDM